MFSGFHATVGKPGFRGISIFLSFSLYTFGRKYLQKCIRLKVFACIRYTVVSNKIYFGILGKPVILCFVYKAIYITRAAVGV